MKTAVKHAIRKKELQDRHQRIQSRLMISDLAYKEQIFEYGMKFLEQTFPADLELAVQFSKHKTYWAWWLNEWNNWEKELLEFIDEHRPFVTLKFWHDEMDALVGDHLTESGFKNYLKLFHHVRI